MSISPPIDITEARAQRISITDELLSVELADGRTITAPIVWYPRLAHATHAERSNWRLIGGGEGIQWPDIDEDISVAGLLAGRASGETQESLRRWLKGRANR
jgi:Protein of unknown function (DUF2442)